jgi:hypothetical protein
MTDDPSIGSAAPHAVVSSAIPITNAQSGAPGRADGAGPSISSEEQELTLFFGDQPDPYLGDYRRWKSEAPGEEILTWRGTHWIWPALFFALAWLLYRRLYVYGFALMAVGILLGLLLPDYAGVVGLPLGILLARYGSNIYIQRGLRYIDKADARGLTGAARAAYLRRAGGISVVGLLLGLGATIAAVALPALPALSPPEPVALPKCDDSEVVKLAAELIARTPSGAGHDAQSWRLADFADRTKSDAVGERECAATARAGATILSVRYVITWYDRERGRFKLRLRID